MEVGSSSLPGTTCAGRRPLDEGGLAQLARASALQAEGQRFESVILHLAMSNDIERSMTICDRQYADGKKLSAASKK